MIPDGRRTASTHYNAVKLWDAASGRELRTLVGHRGAVEAVAFAPDSRWLATGSHDRTICLWDVATGKKLRTFGGQ